MAQAIKSALPSHLKPQLGGKDSDAEFTGRHHGKTRSHMVSTAAFARVSILFLGGFRVSGKCPHLLLYCCALP